MQGLGHRSDASKELADQRKPSDREGLDSCRWEQAASITAVSLSGGSPALVPVAVQDAFQCVAMGDESDITGAITAMVRKRLHHPLAASPSALGFLPFEENAMTDRRAPISVGPG